MEKMDEIFAGVVAPEEQEKVFALQAEEEKKEEKPAYKVHGHDILVKDELVKKYYQTSMKLLVFSNLLVGRFDDNGNYIISKEIKRDLVVMDKEIDDEGEKFFKAANVYMKKNFYYYISLSMLGDGKAKAALYLYEYVGDFFDKEFLVSHIANFIDNYDQDFRGKVRKAFNLVDVDVPNNDFTTPNLAVLMQRMIDDKIRAYEMYDIMCQAYVMRMLKALEGSELGRDIIEEYKKLLAKAGKGKLSWIKQKALLDRAINKFGGYERLKEDLVDTKALFAEAIKQYEEIERRKAAVEVIDIPEKEEKKEEKKASSAKKAAAKKPAAGKAAGKAAAKKPAAKKKAEEKKVKKGGGVSKKELEEIAKQVAKEYAKKYGKSSDEKTDKKENSPKSDKKETPKKDGQDKKTEGPIKVETPPKKEEVGVDLDLDGEDMAILTPEQEQKVTDGQAVGGEGMGIDDQKQDGEGMGVDYDKKVADGQAVGGEGMAIDNQNQDGENMGLDDKKDGKGGAVKRGVLTPEEIAAAEKAAKERANGVKNRFPEKENESYEASM